MKEITPYNELETALTELDNGGRFYNILTKADDGNITSAELSKAAGAATMFTDKQKMIIYLEMSLLDLEQENKDKVLSSLSDDLFTSYKKYQPKYFVPSDDINQAEISSSAIITGIPKLIESKDEFSGFIMIPIMAGNVTTFSMIPIIELFNIYELKDVETGKDIIIAHTKGDGELPEIPLKCGGVIKELKKGKNTKQPATIFLEGLYFTQL
ncbi:hypothetical protein [Chondrinema litorale]|uniref:hypothetical protein n=1 Tax=Chondrinema litorale TaxID=2994555 RepID=UPI00254277F3|nr:hypothetical protein [Chondrinema litorale]UZR99513.1 hypothetical protein OQ292_36590 [Chondrinema litorale]